GVACLMPWVMEWNRPMMGSELEQMATTMGLADSEAVIPAIAALFARIGIPPTLAKLGLAEEQLDWVAEQSCSIERLIQNNPRPLDRSDMRKLLDAAFTGDASLL
ncbi:MAG TPA: iron-containing alcohol dehydrogenase, partial [Candidatus Halomonas stercoripullorum]|nr:iron-containing alcohol dehydrogenase [Candidatus Halomonas stercoripullorum]